MKVAFVDLKAQYQSLKNEIDTAIRNVVEETAFIRGKYVEKFEKEYELRYGVKNCISIGNGTDGIYIALKMLGIGSGDEVITSACSWIATAETITQAGAKVVFADIEPDYYTIDPADIEKKITEKTRAIIPVHFYGQSAEMDKIMSIAGKRGLYVIEDCAQAHFAEYKGKKAGVIGNAGVFSFYPSKNLGAYGDAGCVITNDNDFAKKMRLYANHGSIDKVEHLFEGVNSRMDGLQASILSAKLPHVLEWNRKRNEKSELYMSLLSDVDKIILPKVRKECTHVFHLFVIRCQRRDELRNFLASKDIQTMIHYPKALPFLQAYKYLDHKKEDFPTAFIYQPEILSLPLYPELTYEEIRYVADSIREFYRNKSS
ncbi:MAG: erythromycin biosynthesis sensory transduction protein eryC1 [Lentisphaerae bacterium GWF2_49_21]|nr:MAG: erythromycin biosynthesis sensory transduction protein eryC1 [Lentisphaerae bacterium GWF2_49_21]